MRRGEGDRRSPVVLVLGGTAEGRRLATTLAEAGFRVIYALAGVTARPRVPAGVAVQTGGFGGSAGLAAWLRQQRVAAVVDATHPFATRMQAHVAKAVRMLGLPGFRLARRPWVPGHGDRWLEVDSIAAAGRVLPRESRGLAMLGSRGLMQMAFRGDLWLHARMLAAPQKALPPRWRVLREGPRGTVAGERALLQAVRAAWLVCRNSGGDSGRPRLLAARQLGLPVVMVRAPAPPAGLEVHHEMASLLAVLTARFGFPAANAS